MYTVDHFGTPVPGLLQYIAFSNPWQAELMELYTREYFNMSVAVVCRVEHVYDGH